MTRITTLFFDLDDTIFDFRAAERIALTKALMALHIAPTEALLSEYSRINLSQWQLLEKGKLTRDEVKLRRFRLLFEAFPDVCGGLDVRNASDDVQLPKEAEARRRAAGAEREKREAFYRRAATLYEEALCVGHYYVKDAREILKRLRGEGYRIYIVSNGSSRVQRSRIKSSDLASLTDGIYISEELGFAKPDRRFFEACFAQIRAKEATTRQVTPESTLIIGDSLTSDIQGGINAGIRTVWFCPNARREKGIEPEPDREIDRERDREIGGKPDGEINGKQNREADREIGREQDRETDREINGEIGRETDREPDREIGRKSDGEINREIDRKPDSEAETGTDTETKGEDILPDYRISALSELPALLMRIEADSKR